MSKTSEKDLRQNNIASPSIPNIPADTDVYIYSGPIQFSNVDKLRDLILDKEKKNKKCALFLTTFGGSADDSFRLASCIKNNYSEFMLIIPGLCKSAGTLISMAANVLFFGPKGELGPLDVQMSRRKGGDENETISGLDIFLAMEVMSDKIVDSFFKFHSQLSNKSRIALKTSMEIASEMVAKMYSPIMDQINPLDIGEMHRAMNIAQGYAKVMSSSNFKKDKIGQLIGGYPCHSFVLDKVQAQEFFNKVQDMEPWMKQVQKAIPIVNFPDRNGLILDLSDMLKKQGDKDDSK